MSDQLRTPGQTADDTTVVILDDLVVAVVVDVVVVMKAPTTVAVVHPWMMRGAADANYERQRHRYYIDDNLHVGRKMTASLDGSHHHTEHENPRTLEVEVRDDGDTDDHTRHDTVGPDLHDDDDHTQDIQGHYSDQPEDDTHSRNFPHLANR